MIVEGADISAPQPLGAHRAERPTEPGRRGRTLAQIAVFLGAGGLVLAYSLPGGAYDLVIRQEYGLVTWAMLAGGFALGLLPRARPSRLALIALGALLAYAAWQALSLTWTESAERTTNELARTLDFLGLCALAVAVLDRSTWRSAVAGLGFGAMAVCALSVASRLDPSAFPHNSIIAVFHIDRLSYPFGYWNAVAAWGAMSIAIGLGWSANDSSRARRVVMLGLVPVAGTMTYLSYSRAGVGGAALAVVAVIALGRNRFTALLHVLLAGGGTALTVVAIRAHSQIAHATRSAGSGAVLATLLFGCAACALGALGCSAARTDRWRLPSRAFRPLAATCVVAGLAMAAVFGPHLASKAWHEFRNTKVVQPGANPTRRLTTLSGTRYNLWDVAVKAFEAKPVTGIGAGTYEFWWYRHQRDVENVRNAHSIWLENLAELGVPGLLAIIAFAVTVLCVLGQARRRIRRRASAAAVSASTAAFLVFLLHASVDWMWQTTAVTVLALGLAFSVASRRSREPIRLALWARAVLALAAVGAMTLQVPGLLSTLEVSRSQAAERAGSGSTALAWARAAVNAEPWSASAYEQRGLVLESGSDLPPAAADLRTAISKERTNYKHWLILARIETERGAFAQAARDYAQARRLRRYAIAFGNPPILPRSAVQPPGR